MHDPMSRPPQIGFVSLGCPKALVDSEQILTRLRAEGYDLVPTYQAADLVVVNTCGFIDAAVAESLEAIGEALAENGRVIVTGCLGAKGNIVRDLHPSVLAVTGPHACEEVRDGGPHPSPRPHDPFRGFGAAAGYQTDPRHYAYLKISEGCNHRCTFCIIPQLRGRSGQPTGWRGAAGGGESGPGRGQGTADRVSGYQRLWGGHPLPHGFWNGRPLKTHLTSLAAALGELGVWVRLHYVYPYPHVDEVVPLMAEGKVLPYLDVPLQHASPRVLKAMKRPANTGDTLGRIRRWRDICPDLTLRSTFIVGFSRRDRE